MKKLSTMTKKGGIKVSKIFFPFLSGLVILSLLFVISRYNYLIFHTLAEFFSIVVAWGLFIIVWNLREIIKNDALVFLGIAYLFIGSLDLFHTLSYKGMGVIGAEWGANPATQLWIIARYMESITLCVFPFLLEKRIKILFPIGIYLIITTIAVFTIFFGGIFPDCYTEGVGLTSFKKGSEYIICIFLVSALFFLSKKKKVLDQTIYKLLAVSIVLTIIGELAFTFYVSVYGLSNLIGHFLKIISFYLIYKAIIYTGLKKPYDLIFKEISEKEKYYRTIIQTSMNGFWMTDIQGNFLEVNEAYTQMSGYSTEELLSMQISDIEANENPANVARHIQKGIQTGSDRFETVHRRKDFSTFDVEINFRYLPIKEGRFVVFLQDITNRKRADTALMESEERFKKLSNLTFEGILIHQNGIVIDVNESFSKIFGYTKEELLGKNLIDELFIPHEYQAIVKENIIKNKAIPYEIMGKKKNGRLLPLEIESKNITINKDEFRVTAIRDISKRKQAKEILKKSEEKFRMLFQTSPNAITLTSVEDGVYINVSEGFKKMLGYSREEVIGKSVVALNIWNDTKDRELLVAGLKKHGLVENLEADFKGKEGQTRTGLMSARLLTVDNKNIILAVTQDITERILAEGALKESEQEIRSIFRVAPTGIGVVCDRVIQQGNDRLCEMTGYSKNELIGQSARILYPSDEEYEYVGKEKYRQISNKGTGTVETKWRCKDGEIIDVLLSSTPIDLDDLSKGVTFTALDITNLKIKEFELLESEEKYRSMMEAMDDSAYICSSEFLVEYMNPAMIKRTGCDATGEICHKMIHGLDEKCPWCMHRKVINGKTIKVEIISPKDDKSYHVSNSPVFHTDGSISMLSVFRDITEIKKMESRIQRSQKMESIGTLAGGIAHDFNNILFPILGHTEMLIEDVPEDSPFRDGLNHIYTGALRASELVNQILTFSRQESSELKLMKMQHIIKEVLKLIRSTIPTTIEIKQNIQADCGVIKADPTQIHQIVMNLSTNAYHAMEDTGGKLKVSLKEIKLGEHDVMNPAMILGVYACLIVADTGVGMDKNLIDKIFDPFFTTKKEGKGTGMGLSVVHGIVHGMGGAIQVYSEPGKGTEFRIYFPVEKKSIIEQNIRTEETVQGGAEHILLVDDEEAILTMEKQMLERLGYQVTSRTSSIEALEAFRINPDKFDMVITDMAMPNMPGNRLSVELNKIRSDIPILLCTGFSDAMSNEEVASLGIKGFLLKPIVMKDFSQKIREVLDKN